MLNANRLRIIAVLSCLLAAVPMNMAWSAPPVQLDIQNVAVGYSSSGVPETLTINGTRFGSLTGIVTLGGIDQPVSLWTPLQIVVAVTGVSDPGTYALNVRRADAQGQVFQDEAEVTLGAVGPQGPAGIQGAPGVSGYQRVSQEAQIRTIEGVLTGIHAVCPLGKKVLGGGCYTSLGMESVELKVSEPAEGNGSWACYWHGPNFEQVNVRATAICANVQ